MAGTHETIEVIKGIIHILEQAKMPSGIHIENSRDVTVEGNILINCGIEVKNSEKVEVFANRVNDKTRGEVIGLLYDLIALLKYQPQDRSKIKEVLSEIEQIAEPVYYALISVSTLKDIRGL